MHDMRLIPGILPILLLICSISRAQDTLPRFSASVRGAGKVLVSWHNPFSTVTQISIQRSSDSLKNFTTLLTVPDPRLPENGAVDTRGSDPNAFYRLFIVLENGNYLFSRSQRPRVIAIPTPVAVTKMTKTPEKQNASPDIKPAQEQQDEEDDLPLPDRQRILVSRAYDKGKPGVNTAAPSRIHAAPRLDIDVETIIPVKKGDSLIGQISSKRLRAFRDSVLTRTKDTLVFADDDTIQIRPFIPVEIYRISSYVYTGKYGNIHVSLPDAGQKHYSVRFFDEGNKLLFELSAIKDPFLILDKTNFMHAGWFRYELYEDNRLKEKNKLFIPKDF